MTEDKSPIAAFSGLNCQLFCPLMIVSLFALVYPVGTARLFFFSNWEAREKLVFFSDPFSIDIRIPLEFSLH